MQDAPNAPLHRGIGGKLLYSLPKYYHNPDEITCHPGIMSQMPPLFL